MDEAGWLRSEDPAAMVDYLVRRNPVSGTTAGEKMGNRTSDRKLRLFAAAVCRSHIGLTDTDNWALIDAERGADVDGTDFEAIAGRTEATGAYWACHPDASEAARRWANYAGAGGSKALRAALLREVVGNPFRPVYAVCGCDLFSVRNKIRRCRCAVCSDPTVLAIAGQIDEAKEFEDVPILADAIEDAGGADESCPMCKGVSPEWRVRPPGSEVHGVCESCGNAGSIPSRVVAHLRSPGPHVKGCWALDLILGKE